MTLDSDSDDSEHSSGSVETLFDDEENTELINTQQVNSTANDISHEGATENSSSDNSQSIAELRRKFNRLIETCQDYKDTDEIEDDLQETMTRSIQTGQKLFDSLEGGPSDMYVACLHTKICSEIILSKTERIGTNAGVFHLETFLSSLYEKSPENLDGEYSPENTALMIALQANRAQKTLPTLVSLLGAFDRSVIATQPEVLTQKSRAAPRRKIFLDSEETATQHEQVLVTDEQRTMKDKESPEARSIELLKVLKKTHRINNRMPTNMIEFTMDKDAMEKYFTKLFYVAFLARDGLISVRRKKRKAGDKRKFDSDLYLTPEEPPEKITNGEDNHDSIPRSQHIISFNSKLFKALSNASEGPPLVTFDERSTRGHNPA